MTSGADRITPGSAGRPFHVLAKPSGAACNLDCRYCFFLTKEDLYPGSTFRMSEEVQENYIRQVLTSHPGPEITIAWQGGEPTLMGLDFFRRTVLFVKKYAKPESRVIHTMQTNGVLLTREWCDFLRENDFLIGLSLDGPQPLHDAYRVDKGGQPTFEKVMRALVLLQEHDVQFNILTTVHAANGDHPREVYRFLRDDAGVQYIQLIPIVERVNDEGHVGNQEGNRVTDRSVKPEQWGDFLIQTFDEWVRRDVGRVFVQMFDATLASWAGAPPSLCIFAETCGDAVVLEHNGDLYSCDHFVEPSYLLGNIASDPLLRLLESEAQRKFGADKRETLPRSCKECPVEFACHGECPKNRFMVTPAGEPGLNYLCVGYKAFFNHVDRPMHIMADLLRRGRPPAEVMRILDIKKAWLNSAAAQAGRNDPCPCGSGRKFKKCHGSRD